MAARLTWVEQDQYGTGLPGKVVGLYRKADDTFINLFQDKGKGVYIIDHTISERIYIKVDGAIDAGSDGMMFPADDVALTPDLASILETKGAHLIGVYSGAGFTNNNVQDVLWQELARVATLASTGGAASIGVLDVGGYYTGNQIEAVLAEIGPIKAALNGLTASAAELNKLDGASANVTAANLNMLTAGVASDAGALHRHSMDDLIGFELKPQGEVDLYLISGYEGGGEGKGDVVLDVFYTGASGKAQVRRPDIGGSAHIYDIITTFEAGDLNFSGDPVIGNIVNPGKISEAIKRLAQVAYGQTTALGFNRLVLFRGGCVAGSADGNAASDPTTTTQWQEKSATAKVKLDQPFMQLPAMRRIQGRLQAKAAVAGTPKILMEVSTASQELVVNGTGYDVYEFSLDLTAIPVTGPTQRELKISMRSDGTNLGYVNYMVEVWAEM